MTVEAKIRYNMEPQKAWLFGGDEPRIVFDEPVRAVTPGQTAVAYRGRTVLAGGTIQDPMHAHSHEPPDMPATNGRKMTT